MPENNDLTVLVIDDEESVRKILLSFVEKLGFKTFSAENGAQALDIYKKNKPGIVISDLKMPNVDGFQVIEEVKKNSIYVPIIIVSGAGDIQDAIRALQLGAWDYLLKPIYDIEVLDYAIHKVLERKNLLLDNKNYQDHLESMVKERTLELQNALEGTLQVIVSSVELRDPYTAGHQKKVGLIAKLIAENMGLDDNMVSGIYRAGTIHDLGKIAVPSEILTKPAGLTNNEYSLIKDHAEHGYKILQPIEFPWPIAEMVYQHHEAIDGSGYPRGLAGNEILLEAKIISVADVIEAVASHRPYRASLGLKYALDLLVDYEGKHFESEIVKVCLSLAEKNLIEPVLLSNIKPVRGAKK